jgi:hypothetical protein
MMMMINQLITWTWVLASRPMLRNLIPESQRLRSKATQKVKQLDHFNRRIPRPQKPQEAATLFIGLRWSHRRQQKPHSKVFLSLKHACELRSFRGHFVHCTSRERDLICVSNHSSRILIRSRSCSHNLDGLCYQNVDNYFQQQCDSI